jgi:hypothetical protein
VVDLRGVDMTFEPQRSNRSSTLEIVGSGGSFTTTVGTFFANHPTATLKFTADAAGVTPIVSVGAAPGGADVEGGNLVLDLDDFNFTPSSTLTLMDVAPDALFGTFGNVTFVGNTTAEVNYDYPNGDIFLNNFQRDVVAIDGDYNQNGVVDAADYVVWRKNLGSTNTLPNDTTPGLVSQADYDVWRMSFGATSGAGASLAAVPEPATLTASVLLLAWLGMGATVLRREGRR